MRALNQFELNTVSGGTCNTTEIHNAQLEATFLTTLATGFGFMGGALLAHNINGTAPIGTAPIDPIYGACIGAAAVSLALCVLSLKGMYQYYKEGTA